MICGDIFDRGTENLAIYETCIQLQNEGAIILKGNHEQFVEQCLKEMTTSEIWRTHPSLNLRLWVEKNGGATMFDEIKDLQIEKLLEILRFIQNLPIYFISGKYIFTHAGGNTRKAVEENTEDELVWGEESFPYCPAFKDKVVLFGHIPTWLLHKYKAKGKKERKNTAIWFDTVWKDKIDLDCGSVFGGRLAMLELPIFHEFYV